MNEQAKQLKDRFDELEKQEQELKSQLQGIKAKKRGLRIYLIAEGILAKQPRKPKPPSNQ